MKRALKMKFQKYFSEMLKCKKRSEIRLKSESLYPWRLVIVIVDCKRKFLFTLMRNISCTRLSYGFLIRQYKKCAICYVRKVIMLGNQGDFTSISLPPTAKVCPSAMEANSATL